MDTALKSLLLGSLMLAVTPIGSAQSTNPPAVNPIVVNSNCTLANALNSVKSGAAVGGCASARGVLPEVYTISLPAKTTITLSEALPDLPGNLIIEGNGATVKVGGGTFRAFKISGQANVVTINNLMITGGKSPNDGNGGGGIYNAGSLTLNNCTLYDNGGLYGDGAGIYNNGNLTLNNSTVSGNSGSGLGGGIASAAGVFKLVNSTVFGNSSGAAGGGLAITGGSAILQNSLIAGNKANAAAEILGGATIDASSKNNLYGHNGEDSNAAFAEFDPGFTGVLATSEAGGGVALTSIIKDKLASNGGLTLTHALPSGSYAAGAGDNSVCASAPINNKDQRGATRPQGLSCDIGAFEYAAPATITVGDSCSLADAITSANDNSNAGNANCVAGAGDDIISLPENTTLDLTSALPDITSTVVINGKGSTVKGDSTSFRIFNIADTGDLTLNNTTVSGGKLNSGSGGGLYNSGVLTLNNCTVTNNSTTSYGGGLSNSGTMTLNNSTVSSNAGGGIANLSGTLMLNNITVTANIASSARNAGGGLYLDTGTATLKNSLIAGNTADIGAEIELVDAILNINANNLFGHDAEANQSAALGSLTVGASDRTAFVGGTHPTAMSSILSATLAANSGSTPTHALPIGSPAIDAGNSSVCSAAPINGKDQRGVTRPQGACDIGAYEYVVSSAAGVCGSANALASATAPSTNLCSSGAASNVTGATGNGQWNWACNGTGTSTVNVSCAAPYASQSITLSADPTSIYVNGYSTLTVVNDANLAVTLSSDSAACTLDAANSKVTGAASGKCTVKASQAGTGDNGAARYLAAEDKTVDITVSKIDQTISDFSAAEYAIDFGGTTTVSATASSMLDVTFSTINSSVCSISNGNTVNGLGGGTCTVKASQAGSVLFNTASPEPTLDITVNAIKPTAPSTLTPTPGNRSVSISFTPGSSGGAAISNYEYSLDGGSTFTALVPAVAASPVTINGLFNGTTYSIALRAVNSVGESLSSGTVSVTPTAGNPPPAGQVPAAPTGLIAGAGDGEVTVSFIAPNATGNNAIVNYEYSIDNGVNFIAFDPAVKISPVVIGRLLNGTTYQIVLRAVNIGDRGANSAVVTVIPMAGDVDRDGVIATTEYGVPNASGIGFGDGNNDGDADSGQSNVTSLPVGDIYETLESAAGTNLTKVVLATKPSDFPSNENAVFSGVTFTAGGITSGSTQTFALYFPVEANVFKLLKKNLRTGVWDNVTKAVSTEGNKTKITFDVTDGGDYDSDRLANGSITDPVFPVSKKSGSGSGGGALNSLLLMPLLLIGLMRRRALMRR